MEFEGRARIRPGFDIAPLVDVVFLLHIFFLLTMTYIAPQAFDVSLPASRSSAAAPKEELVVVLRGDDQVTFEGEPVAIEMLGQRLAPRFIGETPPAAEIAADEHASVRAMVGLFDALRSAGARDISVLTRRVETGTEPR